VYAPVVRELRRRGHAVVVAARDRTTSEPLCGSDVQHVQSPARAIGSPLFASSTRRYSDILANAGFGGADELMALAEGWRRIIETSAPDVVVADHAPTALLVARGMRVPRVAFGTGFCCPPGPELPTLQGDAEACVAEEALIRHADAVLRRLGGERLSRLAALYADCDARVLTTVRQLDHFGPRSSAATYVGSWSGRSAGAPPPVWPRPGPRVFLYLRQVDHLDALLARISGSGCACLAVYPGGAVQGRWPGVEVRSDAVDINAAARECDVGICHGGHGTTFELLRHGKPVLILPLVMEQKLLGERVRTPGAGAMASRRSPADAAAALAHLIENRRYGEAAGRLANVIRQYEATAGVGLAADVIEHVLTNRVRTD
jgi:hypothetical protein